MRNSAAQYDLIHEGMASVIWLTVDVLVEALFMITCIAEIASIVVITFSNRRVNAGTLKNLQSEIIRPKNCVETKYD